MHPVRPSAALVEARKREIAARYGAKAKHKRHKQPLTLAAVRISELTRLFDHRYGRVLLPDTDEAVAAVRIMINHIATLKDARARIRDWIGTCAPWLGLASRERLIREATEHPLRYRADKLAWKLRVTSAERQALKIRTIGAIDMTKDERAQAAKLRRLERQRENRLTAGMRRRDEYERQSIERRKPWIAEGISRRSWYRRNAERPLAQV